MSLQFQIQSDRIVKSFQTQIGVKADGIFGPKTCRAGRLFYNLTEDQAAHFFGQISVETAGFTRFEENLNYTSVSRLKQVFPKYFNRAGNDPQQYLNNPEKLANLVYGKRLGNSEPGDGWKFRGRGAIQLTGKGNYRSFAKYLVKNQKIDKEDDFLECPDLVFEFAFESAIFYFNSRVIWPLCVDTSEKTVRKVTKIINGGLAGLEQRIAATEKIRSYYGN